VDKGAKELVNGDKADVVVWGARWCGDCERAIAYLNLCEERDIVGPLHLTRIVFI